jgi:small subunit ribosomal protein S8e
MYHSEKRKSRKKRNYEVGGFFAETTLGEKSNAKRKTKGGGAKTSLTKTQKVNLNINGQNTVCAIVSIDENPANKDYTRRRIITKGAVLTIKKPDGTDAKVRVTSRPGQSGVLNAKTV